MALTGTLTYVSIEMIVRTQVACGAETQEDIARHFFGPGAGLFMDSIMYIFCLGVNVVYLNTVGKIIKTVADSPDSTFTSDWFIKPLLLVIVLLPLSLSENYSRLRYMSFAGVMSIVFLVITVLYLFCSHGVSPSFEEKGLAQVYGPQGKWGDVIAAMNTFVFAFCCQSNVPQIYQEMVPKSLGRMRKASMVSTIMVFAFYVLVGVLAYLVFGTGLNKHDVLFFLEQHFKLGDKVVLVSLILMCTAVCAAFPLNIFPARTSAVSFIKGVKVLCRKAPKGGVAEGEEPALHPWMPQIITLSTCALCLGICLCMPGVEAVLSLLGGSVGAIICYIAPSWCLIKHLSREQVGGVQKYLAFGMLVTGLGIFCLGTFCSIADMVTSA